MTAPDETSAPVAIAVVSYNTRELLGAALASMRSDVDAGRAEVWVVDNGSSDGSAEMVEREFPWARLVAAGENLGFGRAVNRAAALSRSAWVAPANADIELRPGALEALLAAGSADPRVGAVAPRIELPDGSTQRSIQRFPGPGEALLYNAALSGLAGRGMRERLFMAGHYDPARRYDVDWATGAFLIVRREAWEQIGGFDEQQWMYAEDIDLCWRLARAGWLIRYEPTALIRHELSASTSRTFGEEVDTRSVAATYAWMRRRRGPTAAAATAAVHVGGAAARLVAATLLRPLAPARIDAQRAAARGVLRVQWNGFRRSRAR